MTRRSLRLALLALIAPSAVAVPGAAQDDDAVEEAAEEEPSSGAFLTGLEGRPARRPRPSEQVELNMEEGDLMDLLRMMTRITGRRFVVTGNVRAFTATVASSAPITAAEAWRAFLAILHHNGLTVVRRGRFYFVSEAEGVERTPTPIVEDGDEPPWDERFVTWIHRVEHVPVGDVAQLIEGLTSPGGQVITYAPTSTLVLIDTGANLRRLRRILREIDVPGGDAHVWVEPLHFADAEEAAELVRATFDAHEDEPSSNVAAPDRARRSGTPSARTRRASPDGGAETRAATSPSSAAAPQLFRVLPDARTNRLIIVATDAGYRRVLALLGEIDREGGAEASVHVYRLQHGDAESVGATLTALLGDVTPGAGGQDGPRVAGLRDRVRVQPHADLNALVVTATASDYRTVRALIDELDAPSRQVFLEMVVMELTVDRGDELGVNVMSGIADLLGTSAVGLVGGGGPSPDVTSLLSGLAFGVSGDLVSDARLPGGSMPTFGLLVHALASSERANILSTPHVLALDNREANINIGQSVPLQGSSVPTVPGFFPGASPAANDAATAASAMQSFGGANTGRRDTGTIVSVTPHVNDDGEIRLEIRAEDSRQAGVSEGNLNAATFNQSIAETELVAHDGQTVVIGGLMRDATETVRTGVPILSDLPLLGPLFGTTENRTIKRNLLFFVTPYVIRGPGDLRAIFERRLRERREFLDRHMAFDDQWEPPVDYARTRGLVSEILTTMTLLDEEAERAARPAPAPPPHSFRPPIAAPDAARDEIVEEVVEEVVIEETIEEVIVAPLPPPPAP